MNTVRKQTKKRRANASISENKESFCSLYENSLDGVLLTVPETGTVLSANPAACSMLGMTEEEVREAGRSAIVTEDAALPEAFEERTRKGKWRGELTFKRKDGSAFPVEVSSSLFTGPDGVVMSSMSFRDITRQKEVERELRRYELIAKHSRDIIIFMDRDNGRILEANSAAVDTYGYSREELLSLSIHDLRAEDTRPEISQQMAMAYSNGILFETVHRKKSGEPFPVEVSSQGLTVEGVRTLVSLVRDITERKRIEDALRQSEECFAKAFRGSSVALAIARLEDGLYTDVNDSFLRLFEYTRDEVIGHTSGELSVFVNPGDRERLVRLLRDHDSIRNFELIARTKTGNIITVLFSTDTISLNGDEHSINTLVDITDRKRILEELRVSRDQLERRVRERTAELEESHKRYRDLAELLPETVFETDVHGYFTYTNRHALESFGYTEEDIEQGVHIRDVITQEEYAGVTAKVNRIFRGEGSQSGEFTVRRKDGSEFQALIRASRIERHGITTGLRGVATDLTESRRMEAERLELQEQLRQAQKMEAMGTLAGGIAHDFNNMLAVIIGNAELAKDDLEESPEIRHNVEQILKASERGRNLIRQILSFSRKGQGGRESIRLTPLVKETFQLLRSSLPATIDMSLNSSAKIDSIRADPAQIQQVLMNLATNAAYAMRENGGRLAAKLSNATVGIRSNRNHELQPGRYVKLNVSDTGTGMSDEVMRRMFEPFYTTKEPGHGTGMGLAAVYGIVKNHGGSIEVESEEGKGSSFTILFPMADAPEHLEEEPDLPVSQGKERLLLVDDDPHLVNVMQGLLERLGYEVTVATESLDAWNAFRKDPARFDLVITDQTMPQVTGLVLAEKMLGIRSDMPIILCTGYSEMVSPEKAQEIGIREFLMKPSGKVELARTIRKVLDQSRS